MDQAQTEIGTALILRIAPCDVDLRHWITLIDGDHTGRRNRQGRLTIAHVDMHMVISDTVLAAHIEIGITVGCHGYANAVCIPQWTRIHPGVVPALAVIVHADGGFAAAGSRRTLVNPHVRIEPGMISIYSVHQHKGVCVDEVSIVGGSGIETVIIDVTEPRIETCHTGSPGTCQTR